MTDKMFFDVYAHNWGLIIPGPTGTVWEQQTGGISCYHKFLEGTFVPLREPKLLLPNPACKETRDKNLAESWREGLSKEIQDIVADKLLPLHGTPRELGKEDWEIYETTEYWLIIDLLDVLRTVNYESGAPTGLKYGDLWKLIDNEMHWKYERLETGPSKNLDKYRYVENRDGDWPRALPLETDKDYLPGFDDDEGWEWIKILKFNSGHGAGPEVKQLIGKELVLIYPNSD